MPTIRKIRAVTFFSVIHDTPIEFMNMNFYRTPNQVGVPFVSGISFKTAPVELREKIVISQHALTCTGCQLKVKKGLSEVVVLSTCNRVEIYGVAEHSGVAETVLNTVARDGMDVTSYTYAHEGDAAARHLFSVVSGLDSMVLGETEIAGQVKGAYEKAQQVKLTGSVTNRLFQKALQTAKVIRSKTQIQRGATSVGSVALQLAEKIFGQALIHKTVMIIGAGKMGEACVRHLAKKGIKSVIVANRSVERAQKLADEFGGRAVNFMDDGIAEMRNADIVISSTGCPETVLDRNDIAAVMETRRNRPLVLIDIAVPRDIDPRVQEISNVFLYDIDDLEQIVTENVRMRQQEIETCRQIVEEHTVELMAKLSGSVGNVAKKRRVQPGLVLPTPVACAA
jgi:glutamyl-tRNA reductase